MGLQVWLPLNGDLTNNGLSNYNLVMFRGSEVYNNNGKIGKCFYANGVNTIKILNIIPNFYNYTGYSLCAWFYIEGQNTSHSGSAIISAGNWNNQVLNLSVSDWSSDHYTRLRISGTNWNNTYTYNFQTNIWYHVVVSSDGNKTYAYVNGALLGDTASGFLPTNIEGTDMCIGGATYYSGMQFFGRINDVRIYDHVLSPKEVEELSKGLVLHYKLDNNGMGGNNLALHTHDLDIAASKNNLNMYIRGASTRQLRSDGFYESKGTASWQGLSFWANQLNLTVGTKITYSFYIYGNGSSRAFSFYPMMFNSAGTRDTSTGMPISIDGGTYTTANSKAFTATTAITPEYHYVTFEWNQAVANIISDGGSIELSIQVHGTWNDGDWACLFAPKVEIGDTPTPWSPNPADLGIDSSIVYDCSGYGNNGEIINAPKSIVDTNRYKMCTHFSATDQHIKTSAFNTSGFANSYSFAWWEKISSVSPMHWGFSDGNRLNGMYTGRLWNTGDGSDNPLYNPGTTTQVTAPTVNVWHHWVMTGDGNKCRVYQDGVLWAEAKTYKAITGTTIYLNGWANSTQYCSDNASISDFRIYSTALTANQVKELYNTSVTIDNLGNIYSREYDENDNLNITKTGIFGISNIYDNNELTKASILKADKQVQGNTLYEY